MQDLNKTIQEAVNNAMSDETLSAEVQSAIKKLIHERVEKSLNSCGKFAQTIDKKLAEAIDRAICLIDFEQYVPRFEALALEALNQDLVNTHQKAVTNFMKLSQTYPEKQISCEDIFEAYCKFVAEDIDKDCLTIDEDTENTDSPKYENVTVRCDMSVEHNYGVRYTTLRFSCEEDEDGELARCIQLYEVRDKHKILNTFDYGKEPKLSSLRYLNDFDILLLRLKNSDMEVTRPQDFVQDVKPKAEPEVTVSYD